MRMLGALLAGMVTAGIAIIGFEMIAHGFHPFPPGMNPEDPAVMTKYLATVPVSAMLMVIAGHFTGALFGNIVALLIARQKRLPAIIFSILMVIATVANLFMLPHPVWFMIADVAGVILAIFIVFKLTKNP